MKKKKIAYKNYDVPFLYNNIINEILFIYKGTKKKYHVSVEKHSLIYIINNVPILKEKLRCNKKKGEIKIK